MAKGKQSDKNKFQGYFPGPHGLYYRTSPQERVQKAAERRAAREQANLHPQGLLTESNDNSTHPQAANAESPKIPQKFLIPLSPKARLIYEKLSILKVHEAMTTPEILDWLSQEHQKDIDEGTLGKLLKEIKPYGLQNKPRIGYYIPKSS